MTRHFTEPIVEEAALVWLDDSGYAIVCGKQGTTLPSIKEEYCSAKARLAWSLICAESVYWCVGVIDNIHYYPFQYESCGTDSSSFRSGSRCKRGKGGHRHLGAEESPYVFPTPEQLMIDFSAAIARWNDEHGRP